MYKYQKQYKLLKQQLYYLYNNYSNYNKYNNRNNISKNYPTINYVNDTTNINNKTYYIIQIPTS